MRKPLVAGNWKLNGSSESNKLLTEGLQQITGNVDVVVCPSFPYLGQVLESVKGKGIELGAQDVSEAESGAYTGEVSAAMLKDVGVQWVIVGHSERRSLYAETDQRVAEKFVRTVEQGLVPVLCLGETLEERESGVTESVVARQLKAVIDMASSESWQQAVIAYEPVWAIGTGKTATPEQAQAVHAFIRQELTLALGQEVADGVRILYGGSVKPDNAEVLFAQNDIDGGLIGGASLKAADFQAIISAAE